MSQGRSFSPMCRHVMITKHGAMANRLLGCYSTFGFAIAICSITTSLLTPSPKQHHDLHHPRRITSRAKAGSSLFPQVSRYSEPLHSIRRAAGGDIDRVAVGKSEKTRTLYRAKGAPIASATYQTSTPGRDTLTLVNS